MLCLERYPIRMPSSEREAICEIMYDRRCEIPNVWAQLTDEDNFDSGSDKTIYMNACEQGFVISLAAKQRHRIPEIWKQLIVLLSKFREDARVEIKDLGNDMTQLSDEALESLDKNLSGIYKL